jgi:hypothetical protein
MMPHNCHAVSRFLKKDVNSGINDVNQLTFFDKQRKTWGQEIFFFYVVNFCCYYTSNANQFTSFGWHHYSANNVKNLHHYHANGINHLRCLPP